ncbi:MAG: sigma-54 dependent transcriptional regulator [Gammaproteobacteria bacterium]|nr:sigma-54 dependent transcriptional regulator [Gammaproteobacteria bacterium]
MSQARALVIDDEPDIRELLTMTLGRMDIHAEAAADIGGAKRLLSSRQFDICLTDMRLPDGDGLELVEWMQTHAAGIPVAVITAHGNVETAVQALKLGAFDFISKPLDLGHLRNIVSNALRVRPPGKSENTQLQGESPRISELREMINKVARSQAPVHISGESGTGKELVARLIHKNSPRADGPFVAVNCGAIPSELMESEFFGHRKGSFTGAINDKDGLLQSARDGTLFLDEIADLPLPMQVKLLRVIQEKKVRPVGASQEEPVDIRIVSATHRDLAGMVSEGKFREDLYYRINVIELHVPALRDRGGDILILADHILTEIDGNASLAEDARETLLNYSFPGNVRELENMLQRAVTLCSGGNITADDLQLRPPRENGSQPATTANDLGDRVEDVQRQAIVDALEKTRYNKTQAAKLLGLTFRQLRYRIKKLGID